MNTTHHPETTSRVGSLTKSATRAVLAGAVGLAFLGLGAGTAGTANAGPQPTLICPTPVTAGTNGTVTLTNYPGTDQIAMFDSTAGVVLNNGGAPGSTIWGDSPVPGGYLINVIWPQGPSGPNNIFAGYAMPGQSTTGPGGVFPDRAYCTIQINYPASAPAPQPGSAHGGLPAGPLPCPPYPPTGCASKPGLTPIQRQQ
jgi:hypothetical protein